MKKDQISHVYYDSNPRGPISSRLHTDPFSSLLNLAGAGAGAGALNRTHIVHCMFVYQICLEGYSKGPHVAQEKHEIKYRLLLENSMCCTQGVGRDGRTSIRSIYFVCPFYFIF
jgi:hypothetical protein